MECLYEIEPAFWGRVEPDTRLQPQVDLEILGRCHLLRYPNVVVGVSYWHHLDPGIIIFTKLPLLPTADELHAVYLCRITPSSDIIDI